MKQIYLLALVVMMVPAQLQAQSTSDFAASASPDGKSITFYSYRDGKSEIYKMNTDGSHQTRLTTNQAGHDFEPAWSPKGDLIAYIASSQSEPTNFEIMLMASDGSSQRNITSHDANDFSPAWSPDGKSIVFHSDRDGNDEIYTMSVADGKVRRITNNPASDTYGNWSHDGRYLAFSSDREEGKTRIFIYDMETQETKRLTKGDTDEFGGRWSPREHKLVFTTRADGDNDVFLINMDGTGLRNVTNNYEQDYFPSWSHDGKKVYFTSAFNGGDEIYSIDLASGKQQNLTNTSTYNGAPSLSPDGKLVYFNSKRDNNQEVYRITIDGKKEKRITNTLSGESDPSGNANDLYYVESGDIHKMTLRTGAVQNLTNTQATERTPVLSGDGKSLLFVSNEGTEHDQIWMMNLLSGQKKQITNHETHHGGLSWSADGSRIVFHRIAGRQVDLWVMNGDGSNQQQVTEGQGANFNASFSPDGKEIVFVSNRDGRSSREIYKMHLESKEVTRLTEGHGRNDMPRWSGSGRIIFESTRDGNPHIYSMNADGSQKKQLTFLSR